MSRAVLAKLSLALASDLLWHIERESHPAFAPVALEETAAISSTSWRDPSMCAWTNWLLSEYAGRDAEVCTGRIVDHPRSAKRWSCTLCTRSTRHDIINEPNAYQTVDFLDVRPQNRPCQVVYRREHGAGGIGCVGQVVQPANCASRHRALWLSSTASATRQMRDAEVTAGSSAAAATASQPLFICRWWHQYLAVPLRAGLQNCNDRYNR